MRLRLLLLASLACLPLGHVAADEGEVSPMTPIRPPSPGSDGARPPGPSSDAGLHPGSRRRPSSMDPRAPNMNAPAFCDGAPPPNREPHVAGDRWASFVLDGSCEMHREAHCVRGGLAGGSSPPTDCVEVAFHEGETRVVETPEDVPLLCARCPEGMGTSGEFPICSDAILEAARAERRIFDLRKADTDRWEEVWRAATATLARRDATPAQRASAELDLLDIVRAAADTVSYCEDYQPLLPSPPEDRPEAIWRLTRIDLNKELVFGGRTEGEGTALEVAAAFQQMNVYPGAFLGRGNRFSADALIFALLHEMRHMATPNHGNGESGVPELVADAEHRLNELEDYQMMFLHPFFHAIPELERPWFHETFDYGREQELACFASAWNVGDASRGYPEGTTPGNGGAPPPGSGMMGLPMIALGMRGGMASQTNRPMTMPSPVPARCPRGHLTGPQRCHVAAWAKRNVVMRSYMVRTIGVTEYPQPWNTLAYWSLLLPFRSSPACDEHGNPTTPARPPARGRGGR